MICGDFQASAWLDIHRLHQSQRESNPCGRLLRPPGNFTVGSLGDEA
jgi:hypothetical protein